MKKVLIVDDDKLIRENLSQKLIEKGYAITELEDGDQVLDSLKNSIPDVIMLDLFMKRMGGIECIELIKKEHKNLICKIIIMTNSESQEMFSKAFDLGVNTYLNKSSRSLDEMVKIVERKEKQLCF